LPAAAVIRRGATCNDGWASGDDLRLSWAGRARGRACASRAGRCSRSGKKAGNRASDLGIQPVQAPPGAIP